MVGWEVYSGRIEVYERGWSKKVEVVKKVESKNVEFHSNVTVVFIESTKRQAYYYVTLTGKD